MKTSILNKSQILNKFDIRIDAEYFDPEYLQEDFLIDHKGCFSFSDKNVRGGKRLPKGCKFSQKGIPYIRAEDIKNYFVEYENTPRISEELSEKLKHYRTEYNDVLLTIVGNSIGDVGIVKFKADKCNLTENCAKIVNLKDFIPEYLYCFLISKYGQNQIKREKVGTAQPKLALTRIRKFKIPKVNKNLQLKLKNIIDKSYNLFYTSKNCYYTALNILNEELDIKSLEKDNCNCYVKNYSQSVAKNNRMDAEYFSTKYEYILKLIKNYKNGYCKFINAVNTNDENYNPEKNKLYKYIELANVLPFGEIKNETLDYGCNLPERARRIVKENDVIISSIEGSLDCIAIITEKNNQSICSNGFYVMNSHIINSETLFCFFNSPLGKLQLKRGCSGTILAAISRDELNKVLIPKIDRNTQNKIQNNIKKMYQTKHQAKQLLEIAKKAVEIAIEQNEEYAISWINKQLSEVEI